MSWENFVDNLYQGMQGIRSAVDELEKDESKGNLGEPTEERAEKTEELLEEIKDHINRLESSLEWLREENFPASVSFLLRET